MYQRFSVSVAESAMVLVAQVCMHIQKQTKSKQHIIWQAKSPHTYIVTFT